MLTVYGMLVMNTESPLRVVKKDDLWKLVDEQAEGAPRAAKDSDRDGKLGD